MQEGQAPRWGLSYGRSWPPGRNRAEPCTRVHGQAGNRSHEPARAPKPTFPTRPLAIEPLLEPLALGPGNGRVAVYDLNQLTWFRRSQRSSPAAIWPSVRVARPEAPGHPADRTGQGHPPARETRGSDAAGSGAMAYKDRRPEPAVPREPRCVLPRRQSTPPPLLLARSAVIAIRRAGHTGHRASCGRNI